MTTGAPADLHWREGSGREGSSREGLAAEAAHAAFLLDVFGMAQPERALPPFWHVFGLFDRDGRCVAAAETAGLALLVDGAVRRVAGLRLVGVVADRRGQGLFRRLMQRALRDGGPMLLYAEQPALYPGFAPLPQHAFVGAAPAATPVEAARPLSLATDGPLIRRLLAERGPVSREAALIDAPALFLDRLAGDRDLRLAHLPGADALLAYEEDGDALVLADVAAATMPELPAILGALPRRYAQVRTLFPPDRLEWPGEPRPDDTGLMARGLTPPRRPFRLPPTTEF